MTPPSFPAHEPARMRALVFDPSRGLTLARVPEPRHDGQCRIRVRMAGICGTDLQLLEGYAGFAGIPGHEFVGVVEAVSSDADTHWIGKRVVGEINIGCGTCRWCATGQKEHCDTRAVVGIRQHDGAFTEIVTLPATNLHEVPDTIDDETAVFVEPTAAACRIFEQITIDRGARVAVVGDGRMGLIVAQVLRTAAPDVVVFGRHARKLAIARAVGLQAALAHAALAPADRFDVVVDVTGRPEGLQRALALVRPRGTLVMKSTFHGEAALESWPIVVDEVTLVGSRCGPFSPAIALLASGAIQVKPLIARITTLEDHLAAFEEARHGLKVLFAMA